MGWPPWLMPRPPRRSVHTERDDRRDRIVLVVCLVAIMIIFGLALAFAIMARAY